MLFVALTVSVITFFHFFGKLYLTNDNWPYFLSPYTHCEVVRLEPMALSVTSNIDHSLSVREFNILSSSYFGIDFGNCIYSATEQQMHSSLIIVLPVGRLSHSFLLACLTLLGLVCSLVVVHAPYVTVIPALEGMVGLRAS